jgi:hypothetical protein
MGLLVGYLGLERGVLVVDGEWYNDNGCVRCRYGASLGGSKTRKRNILRVF